MKPTRRLFLEFEDAAKALSVQLDQLGNAAAMMYSASNHPELGGRFMSSRSLLEAELRATKKVQKRWSNIVGLLK